MRHLPGKIILFALFLGIAPTVTSADKQSGKETGVPVADLIARLGDRSFRVRQAAGRALEDRGEEALPALRGALNHEDEEIRRRVEVLTEKIERLVLLTPKRVTIKMKDRPVGDIVAELAKQTGYNLQFQGGGMVRKFSINLENATYWQAMDIICNGAGLVPNCDENQGIIFLYAQDTVSPYVSQAGAFRLVANNFNYSRNVNLANIPRGGFDPNNQADNNLNFGFMVQAEPKTPLLSVGVPKLTKAVDENDLSLLPRWADDDEPIRVNYYDGGMYRSFQHNTNAVMAKPAKNATKAKLIQGSVTVTILSGTRPEVVVDKLAVGKKKLHGAGESTEIDVEEMTEQNKIYCLTLTIKKILKIGEQQDFNWINGVQQKLELADAKGVKYVSNGINNYISNSPTMLKAVYQFSPPQKGKVGPPAKLILNQWLTIAHELEFEFKDLPLP